VMAELSATSLPEMPAVRVSPAVEARRNSTIALEPPPLRSRRSQRIQMAVAVGGLLLLAALGVGWWLLRSSSPSGVGTGTPPMSQAPGSGTKPPSTAPPEGPVEVKNPPIPVPPGGGE
jgi:hypothetical protein